jgi:hypothetical protein
VAVLAAVVESRPVHDSEPGPVALPAVRGPADLPALVDAIRSASDEDGTAIVVLPTWGPPRLRETVDAARMILGVRRLAIVETGLPPLAAGVAAGMLAGVLRRVGDAQVAAQLFPHIHRGLVSLAWLPSVTGLEHLDVPLGLHLRSYVTRSGFVAVTHPDPAVLRVGDAEHPLTITLPPRPRVYVADRAGDLDWYSQRLLPHLEGAPVTMVGPSAAGPGWWGAKRLMEVVAICGDLDLVTVTARGAVSFGPCRWCGASLAGASSAAASPTAASPAGACTRCGAAPPGQTMTETTKETAQ